MSKAKRRPKLSQALRDLRRDMGHTQESFARLMGVTVTTVAIWETKRPPAGIVLFRLAEMAESSELPEHQSFFEEAAREDLEAFSTPVAARQDIEEEVLRWKNIRKAIGQIRKKTWEHAALLRPHLDEADEENSKIAHEIDDLTNHLERWCQEAKDWSWRNQK